MRTNAPSRRSGRLAAGTALALLLALLAPLPAQGEEDEPPRQDIRLGNTANMRMGRDAQGNEVMEVRRPPKPDAAAEPVGPFFIYPQVGLPQAGGTAGGQTGPGSSTTGGGQPAVPAKDVLHYRPGQAPVGLPGGGTGQPIRSRSGSGS